MQVPYSKIVLQNTDIPKVLATVLGEHKFEKIFKIMTEIYNFELLFKVMQNTDIPKVLAIALSELNVGKCENNNDRKCTNFDPLFTRSCRILTIPRVLAIA